MLTAKYQAEQNELAEKIDDLTAELDTAKQTESDASIQKLGEQLAVILLRLRRPVLNSCQHIGVERIVADIVWRTFAVDPTKPILATRSTTVREQFPTKTKGWFATRRRNGFALREPMKLSYPRMFLK